MKKKMRKTLKFPTVAKLLSTDIQKTKKKVDKLKIEIKNKNSYQSTLFR